MLARCISRSRSPSPGPWGDSERAQSDDRGPSGVIDHVLEPEPRPWIPSLASSSGTFNVENNSGGSYRPSGGPAPVLNTTPGSRLRLKTVVEDSIHLTPAERIEAVGLDEEEGDDWVNDNLDHVRRWVSELEPPICPVVRSCRTPEPVAELGAQDASVAVVLPSTSGSVTISIRRVVRSAAPGSDVDSDYDDEFDHQTIIDNAALGQTARDIPSDEELDDHERDIMHSIDRAMDEAIDAMIGVSGDFTWQHNYDSFRGVQETFSGPTPGSINDYDTPYDAFIDIWDIGIMEHIVRETNRYAKQTIDEVKATLKPGSRLRSWTDTNVDEMYVLLAVYMFMGLSNRTSQHEYWKQTGYLAMPKFRHIMSYDRYILLNKFIHFSDNSAPRQNLPPDDSASRQDLLTSEEISSAKLAKLAPVITHLNSKFSTLYNLSQEIAIDESLTLFKGRLPWIQVIKSKSARAGIKSYELCESRTGYLAKFEIYTGKNSERSDVTSPSADLASKSAQVVLALLKGLEHRGHCITMDNFYNSPSLARYLKSLRFDCLGTLRVNRKHVPKDIAKAPKNVPKGTIIARHCGDVSCIAWKDAKIVTMISTYHDSETYVDRKAGRELVKPIVVKDYNNTMGGINLKDQKLSMYLLERKRCLKWYMKMFKRLLNVSVHNALILLLDSLKRRNKSIITHRNFREQLAESLIEKHRRLTLSCIRVRSVEMRLRKDLLHAPKILIRKTRGACIVCRGKNIQKKTYMHCDTCDVSLCVGDCWRDWHSLQHLEGRKIYIRRRRRIC